jgi:hypothetical protein
LSVLGSSAGWSDLLEQMLPDILTLVVDTWNGLPRPLRNRREGAISELLCRALRENRRVRGLPLYVMLEMVEIHPALRRRHGRLDIAFLPSGGSGAPDERIYFCLECKRLNVTRDGQRRRGGTDYVVHGMRRFVTGQYADCVEHGGMLGYVLDGDTAGASENVAANVRRRHRALGMAAPGELRDSSVLSLPTARETDHRRRNRRSLRLHHMFVTVAAPPARKRSATS